MAFTDPHATLLQLGLRDGMKVGDFGAGVGHYALSASGMVGDEGRVYAFDVQEEVLARLSKDADSKGVKNLTTLWCDFEKLHATKLKDEILDGAILSNALFQLEDKGGALAEIKRTLKPRGKLLLIEWSGPHGGMGPADERVITETDALGLLEKAGFEKFKSFDPGDHHYALVVMKHA